MRCLSDCRDVARCRGLAILLGLLLATVGSLPGNPVAGAAVGDIYPVHEGGRARHSAAVEYEGRLFVLWSDISTVEDWQLRLSVSGAADGSAWEAPRAVEGDGTLKADFPRLKRSPGPDGRLHAVWSDAALSGRVRHAWFTPGPGRDPADPAQWQYRTVSESGKVAAFDLDPAGNAFIVWDSTQAKAIFGRAWDAATEGDGPVRTLAENARLAGVAATTDRLHLVWVEAASPNRPFYRAVGKGWDPLPGEGPQELGDGRAGDPSPQIVRDGVGGVHLAWAMASRPGPNGLLWEVFYRRRPANEALGGLERVSHNWYDGTGTGNANHNNVALTLDEAGTPWIAWRGLESGRGQIYERGRGPDGWPDYEKGEALARFCLSCANGGAARDPEYGAPAGGARQLTWQQSDRSGGERVQYSRRTGGAPAPTPPTAPPPAPPALPPLEGVSPEFCFPETGFCVRGAFLAYWQQHGGLAINGFPLSEAFTQTLEDGRAYRVQYFERVRLEYHPENAPPNDILLGQFGRRLHPADPPVEPRPGAAYFPETGHTLGEGFLAYWQANGGLPSFGFPISEVITERLEDGREYQVQYFERARFEYHPENTPPNDILLGQFGRRVLAETGGQR